MGRVRPVFGASWITSGVLAVGLVAPVAGPGAAFAQTPPADPAIAPAPQATAVDTRRIYTPVDFARFAPRTAGDMVAQVPGFTAREADEERGLGQASENVLIDGRRIANKSGGALDQLRKLPATAVLRIEIADAATLGIAGLVGQVANVVLRPGAIGGGRFEWKPEIRAHFARTNLLRGSASYTGRSGPLDFTLSVENQAGRGGFGGPVAVTGPGGAAIERRDELYHGEYDELSVKTRFNLDLPGSATAALTLAVKPTWEASYDRERRIRTDGDDRTRLLNSRARGGTYDIDGNVEFAAGPGRLKLIGVRHYEYDPRVSTQTTRFDSGADPTGVRFGRTAFVGETVARVEYSWTTGRNGWQLSFERAYNSLDQRGTLSELGSDGRFVAVPFPEGSGAVQEVRYEGTATYSRPLARTLDLQVVAGAEASRLARIDGDTAPRRFFRPKGSASLAWRPGGGWETSLKLSRRVGQISFYDFLSQPNLALDRRNAGNPDLVPPQSWELESQTTRDLGRWGKAQLRLYGHRVEDIVDIVPVGIDGEGVGNLPHASRFGAESISTLQLDPIGWVGARLDATLGFERTRVRDPLTALLRPIGETRDGWAEVTLRRDVPHSPLAWGLGGEYEHYARAFYLSQVEDNNEGPWFVRAYLEHKNVAGLTVRAQVLNILNARHRYDRDVYDGYRTTTPLLFRQRADQLIGPIFRLTVTGTF